MDTLIINSYAGSLVLGAMALKRPIRGSYEDVGFGIGIQKANFPTLNFRDTIREWPEDDLTDTVVLAHPPCAAFSQQNVSKAKRGIDTDAFECTRKVLKYTMGHNAAAIAVESVNGAMAGAWDVHESFAARYGYNVYRVLKNSLLFGVPQFRERFWAVFVRKGAAEPVMKWRLSPIFKNVGDVLDPIMPGTPLPRLDESIDKFIARLVKEAGLTSQQARACLRPKMTNAHKRKSFSLVVQERHFPNQHHKHICRQYIANFSSSQPSILAPWGYAPVLLGSSLWVYEGRPVPEEGYKAIMGFPTDYVFPEPSYRREMRKYLSKGVCPPVATWVLDNLLTHLGVEHQASPLTSGTAAYEKDVAPSHIVSFRVSKNLILEKLEARMQGQRHDDLLPLRNEEEDLEPEGLDEEESAVA